jgi:hypothetical protein
VLADSVRYVLSLMYTDRCLIGISTYVHPGLPTVGNLAGHLHDMALTRPRHILSHDQPKVETFFPQTRTCSGL